MRYLKVDGYNNLVRDKNTNSIINTNMNEYQEYISRRESKSKEDKKIEDLETDVSAIKNDLDEIKSLLRNLLNEPR